MLTVVNTNANQWLDRPNPNPKPNPNPNPNQRGGLTRSAPPMACSGTGEVCGQTSTAASGAPCIYSDMN